MEVSGQLYAPSSLPPSPQGKSRICKLKVTTYVCFNIGVMRLREAEKSSCGGGGGGGGATGNQTAGSSNSPGNSKCAHRGLLQSANNSKRGHIIPQLKTQHNL